ncbi:MAG: hypothetical protein M1355_02315, partial [Patescibacteria group bacterium]|nr:hypothetical protein [Patescibacteria group bacterium]
LYKAKSLTTLKLWGKILSSLTFEEKVRFVWSKVNFEEFKTSGLNVSEVENMIDELIGNTPGADVFLLLLETEKGKVLGKLRGQRGFDVLKIAEMFGGKGQFHSAEFELMNQEFAKATEEISSKILNYLKKTLGVETENTKRVVIPLQKLDKERLYESKEVKPIAEETSEHIETQIPEAVIGTAEREAKETTSDVAKPVEEKEKEAIDEIKDIINNEDSVSFEAPEVTDAISKAIESLEKESAKLDEIQKEAKNKGDMTPLRDVLKNKEIGGKKIDDSVFYDNKGDMTAPSETEITHKDPDIDTDDEVRVWTEN